VTVVVDSGPNRPWPEAFWPPSAPGYTFGPPGPPAAGPSWHPTATHLDQIHDLRDQVGHRRVGLYAGSWVFMASWPAI